jgi:hypothetical protein
MGRRKLPSRYRRVALLTVSDGQGERTIEQLSEEMGGPPAFPNPRTVSEPVLMKKCLHCEGVSLFAFQRDAELMPDRRVSLGDGVTIELAVIDISKFKRVTSRPEDAARVRHRRGHGRPPELRSYWTDLWREIAKADAAADCAEGQEMNGLLDFLDRSSLGGQADRAGT